MDCTKERLRISKTTAIAYNIRHEANSKLLCPFLTFTHPFSLFFFFSLTHFFFFLFTHTLLFTFPFLSLFLSHHLHPPFFTPSFLFFFLLSSPPSLFLHPLSNCIKLIDSMVRMVPLEVLLDFIKNTAVCLSVAISFPLLLH
jgi:hypothetical protein